MTVIFYLESAQSFALFDPKKSKKHENPAHKMAVTVETEKITQLLDLVQKILIRGPHAFFQSQCKIHVVLQQTPWSSHTSHHCLPARSPSICSFFPEFLLEKHCTITKKSPEKSPAQSCAATILPLCTGFVCQESFVPQQTYCDF